MFNFSHYDARIKELREEIEKDTTNQTWRITLESRFVRFSLMNAVQRTIRVVDQLDPEKTAVIDRSGLTTFACTELSSLVGTIIESVTLLAGRTVLKDPVGMEAQLRLYKEMGGT